MRIKVRIGRARHAFKAPSVEIEAHGNYAVLERYALIRDESESKYRPRNVGASVAFLKDVDGTLSLVYGRISKIHSNPKGSYTGIDVYDREGTKHYVGWHEHVTI